MTWDVISFFIYQVDSFLDNEKRSTSSRLQRLAEKMDAMISTLFLVAKYFKRRNST